MFDHINSILYKTNTNAALESVEAGNDFVPFLVQRWCSMHSAPVTVILNETTNKYWKSLENNKEWYIALNTVLPACKFKRIQYIKKSKKEIVKKNSETIQKIANNLEISTREVNQYIEQFNLKIPNEEKPTT
jgi:hypothetical protein